MANEIKKGELFIKEVLARLTGDGHEALAAKISRKSISAIDSQLASLSSKQVDLENSLEDAVEALKIATYPTSVFSSNEDYVKGILRAQQSVDQAKENLEATNKAIEYFNKLLIKF